MFRVPRRTHARGIANQLSRYYGSPNANVWRQDRQARARLIQQARRRCRITRPNPGYGSPHSSVAAAILYGSHHRFSFAVPAHGAGPVATFLASTSRRGDFIANILLYLPVGFFFVQSLRRHEGRPAALRLVLLGSAADGPLFGWAQFPGPTGGSPRADALAFLARPFLYSCVICLIGNAVRARWPVAALLATALAAIGWKEAYLPGRTSGSSVTLMGMMIAVIPQAHKSSATPLRP